MSEDSIDSEVPERNSVTKESNAFLERLSKKSYRGLDYLSAHGLDFGFKVMIYAGNLMVAGMARNTWEAGKATTESLSQGNFGRPPLEGLQLL